MLAIEMRRFFQSHIDKYKWAFMKLSGGLRIMNRLGIYLKSKYTNSLQIQFDDQKAVGGLIHLLNVR